jgi:hypothetical protein
MTRRELILGSVATGILSLVKTKDVFAASEWTAEVVQAAKDTEAKYDLPHGICRAMNLQENSGRLHNPFPRVEKGFFNVGEKHYQFVRNSTEKFFEENPGLVEILPYDVERFQQATSWGPWQLMGFNLRAAGCTMPFLANVTLAQHFEFWGRFMSDIWKRSGRNLYKAMKLYNGPKMPMSYYNHVSANIKKFAY